MYRLEALILMKMSSEASVAALRKSFAASLPKVARAGAVSVKGARLSLPVAAEAAMAAK